jgi:RimK family alpha-L-glutamate ligase
MSRTLRELSRSGEKTIVFAFGRFNPPTVGHERLVDSVLNLARRYSADARIYISNTQDARKNPLRPDDKLDIMQKSFRNITVVGSREIVSPFHAFDALVKEGYTQIYMVAGSDRIPEFKRSFLNYIKKENIPVKFDVLSAGERDPDAEGVAGMSASKLRSLASAGDVETFMTGLPSRLSPRDKKRAYDLVRSGMGLSESYDMTKDTDKSILILALTSSNKTAGTLERIRIACEKKGVAFEIVRANHAYIDTGQVKENVLEIYNYNGKGDVLKLVPNRTLCFVRGGTLNSEVGTALIRILENYGVFTINERKTMDFCSNKLASMIELERQGVPIPRTSYIPSKADIDVALKKIGGKFPVVIKTITGAEGIGVSIVDSYASLKSVLQSLWKYGAEVLVQEYLKVDFDVRTLVLDGKIFACARRDRTNKDDFRTNLALGNKGGPYELSDEEKEVVLKAAKISGGFYVGVDHLIKDGKPYVLELNGSPGSTNMYFNYYTNKGRTKKVDGQKLIENLIDYVSDKNRWEIPSVEAGLIETISIDGESFEAKLDTGNFGHNSMHAKDIQITGNFPNRKVTYIDHNGKKQTHSIASIAKVMSSPTTREKRPTIEIDVKFRGMKFEKVRFNLTDRSENSYPILLGSRFLEKAKVSVNPSKIHQLPEENRSMKLKSLLEREHYLLEANRREEAKKTRALIEQEKEKLLGSYVFEETAIDIDEEFEHHIHEVSPPDGPARRFSKKARVKRQFQQRYGADDWKKVFYGTAWNMYNRSDTKEEVESAVTEELATIRIDKNRFPNPLPAPMKSVFLVKGELDGDKTDDRIRTRKSRFPASILKPSQSEVFLGKSLGMAIGGVAGGDLGAVISSDNHILDGHHRWAATMFSDPRKAVIGTMVNLTIGDLVPVLRAVGDALGNARRGVPGGGDVNLFSATFQDVLDAVKDGKNMDSRFYNKEKALAWLESIGGEEELKKRFAVLQRTTPPAGAPPRTDMPVIDDDKGQVRLVSDLLRAGKIDINPPYTKTKDVAKRPEFAAAAAVMRRTGVYESLDSEKEEKYKKWKELVNMGPKELEKFIDSEEGQEAGLSRKEAGDAGSSGGKITSGRDSARAIVRMLQKKKEDWTSNDWEWVGKQISFISRMKGNEGPNRDDKGRPTRKLLSLKIWGHDPEK